MKMLWHGHDLLIHFVLFLTITIKLGTVASSKDSSCERLNTSLTYRQEEAPREISAVLPLIVEKVNRELEGVVDVEVGWNGAGMHRRIVGTHIVQCSVTRLLTAVLHNDNDDDGHSYTVGEDEFGRKVVTQCFQIPYILLDTDECTLPKDHAMAHRCDESSVCVNTIGSYECACRGSLPPGYVVGGRRNNNKAVNDTFWEGVIATGEKWDRSLDSSGASSCPDRPSTKSCCVDDAHGMEGSKCRSNFRCPIDPCRTSGGNECASNAKCKRADSPLSRPNYRCECPRGLMGNGRVCQKGDVKPKPMVKYDGVTPTDETLRNNFYCGCTKPIVDACDGFPKCEGKNEICTVTPSNKPKCACKPGFVKESDRYGCVDETPPVLRLREDPQGDSTTRLIQGDIYKEHAIDIIDDNAEDYLRSLKMAYSRPLPPGCLTKVQEFHVNYTVATPWTSPPYVRVTRTVIVEDIDECGLDVGVYRRKCPSLIPRCDVEGGAVCRNTVGSYTCVCPKYTSGDGFLKLGVDGDDAPEGFEGGTGCRDTSKPVIEVLGPNPKVFETCRFNGLTGVMAGTHDHSGENDDLLLQQRKRYGGDIKNLIKSTAGAELCATKHSNPNPSPTDCIRAIDQTHEGPVDLTSKVIVGDPVQTSTLSWKVPYNVVDDAGNGAVTVWRDVVVEECELGDASSLNEDDNGVDLDLDLLRQKIRNEILADKEREIELAVDSAVSRALREERSKNENLVTKTAETLGCPRCPECDCAKSGTLFTKSQCATMCRESGSSGTCPHSARSPQEGMSSNSEAGSIFSFFGIFVYLYNYGLWNFLYTTFMCAVSLLVLLIAWRTFQHLMIYRENEYYDRQEEERERAMRDAVTYYRSPSHPSPSYSNTAGVLSPPGSVPNTNHQSNGVFTPQENSRMYGNGQHQDDNSIYLTRSAGSNNGTNMSPIAPTRSDGTPVNNNPSLGAVRGTPYPSNMRRRY